MVDISDFIHDTVNANWDTNIIAKPTLVQASSTTLSSAKVRKKHTANTIYFFRFEKKRTKTYAFTRDLEWRVPVLLAGTTWANLLLLEQGFEDALHEYLDDAGRIYQHLEIELQDISVRKPRSSYRMMGWVDVWKFGESIAT